jgi:hypothetical protein
MKFLAQSVLLISAGWPLACVLIWAELVDRWTALQPTIYLFAALAFIGCPLTLFIVKRSKAIWGSISYESVVGYLLLYVLVAVWSFDVVRGRLGG